MTVEIKKGLEGVVFDESAISRAIPEECSLIYRGYLVPELAEKCSFEEVAYLLWHQELPNQNELKAFLEYERAHRQLSPELHNAIMQFPRFAHPMDMLKTAVSFLGMEDKEAENDSPRANLDKAIKLMARIPNVVASCYRLRKGEKPIAPRRDLSFSENFFHMCFGAIPDQRVVKAFDVSLVLYAEHGFNASTFVARCITSSESDVYSAVVGAIASLKGPLHGGANEAVMRMLLEIDSVERAAPWLEEALSEKRKIMGFGHRLYKKGDSRVPTMKKYRDSIASLCHGEKWVQISDLLEKAMSEKKGIPVNLDFPAGPTYYLMGFDVESFTPIFVMSRVSGWTAHVIEQTASNRLVRPLSRYTGPANRAVPALETRS